MDFEQYGKLESDKTVCRKIMDGSRRYHACQHILESNCNFDWSDCCDLGLLLSFIHLYYIKREFKRDVCAKNGADIFAGKIETDRI